MKIFLISVSGSSSVKPGEVDSKLWLNEDEEKERYEEDGLFSVYINTEEVTERGREEREIDVKLTFVKNVIQVECFCCLHKLKKFKVFRT